MKLLMRALLTSFVPLASSLIACSAGSDSAAGSDEGRDTGANGANQTFTPAAKQLWDSYVNEANAAPLQSDCRPVRVPATDPSTNQLLARPKGVVVLFHGYTACPQQFMNFDRSVDGRTETVGLASKLSKAGYEVLLPVLPGHGHQPKPNPAWTGSNPNADPNKWPVLDQIGDMPAPLPVGDQLEGSPYTKLVDRMNAIMAALPDTANRVVGGISVGAVLATQAVLRAKKPYTRALVAAPFYQAHDAQLNIIRTAAQLASDRATDLTEKGILSTVAQGSLDPSVFAKLIQTAAWAQIGESPIGWGAGCELEERAKGRAGICQFKAKNLASVLIYGKRVQDSVSALSNTPTLFQMTGVFDDPVINNHEAFGVAAKITNVVSDSRAKLCVFQNASHSMFSWHDNPATPKPWIPALEGRTVDFLTDSQASGKFFPTSGTANDPGGTVPVCSVD